MTLTEQQFQKELDELSNFLKLQSINSESLIGFAKKAPPNYDWLIEDFLCSGTIMTLWGSQGIGKTHFILDLALRISGSGKDFLGLPIKKHGPIIYIGLEAPGMIANAVNNYPGYEPISKEIEENWFGYEECYFIQDLTLRKIPDDFNILKKTIIEKEAIVTIIDPITSIDWSVKISDNDMVNIVMKQFDHIASETNCVIILIHHRRKVSHAETQFLSEESESDSAIGANAWLSKAASRYQLLKAKDEGLCLKSRPGKLPDCGIIKLRQNCINGFFERRY